MIIDHTDTNMPIPDHKHQYQYLSLDLYLKPIYMFGFILICTFIWSFQSQIPDLLKPV